MTCVVSQPYAVVGNQSCPGVLGHNWRLTVPEVIYPDTCPIDTTSSTTWASGSSATLPPMPATSSPVPHHNFPSAELRRYGAPLASEFLLTPTPKTYSPWNVHHPRLDSPPPRANVSSETYQRHRPCTMAPTPLFLSVSGLPAHVAGPVAFGPAKFGLRWAVHLLIFWMVLV
jgi:hypothetical protein